MVALSSKAVRRGGHIALIGVLAGRGEFDPRLMMLKAARLQGIFVGSREMFEEMNRLFYHQEEPFGSASIYAQWCVMRLAKEHGVTVLLDGQGADEMLAGYHPYLNIVANDLFKAMKLPSFVALRSNYKTLHGRPLGSLTSTLRQSVPNGPKKLVKKLKVYEYLVY